MIDGTNFVKSSWLKNENDRSKRAFLLLESLDFYVLAMVGLAERIGR